MSDLKVDGICLRSIDYKDNDKLITIYGFGLGKITVNARGVKRAKATLKNAVSPLSFGKYILVCNKGYYTLIGFDLIDSFYNIRLDIEKYYASSCVLELLEKVSIEISDEIAARALTCINELCYGTVNTYECYLKFLIDYIKLLGYSINLEGCSVCGVSEGQKKYFSPSDGGIVFECCSTSDSNLMTNEDLEMLSNLKNGKKLDNVGEFSYKIIHRFLYEYIKYVLSEVRSIEEFLKL